MWPSEYFDDVAPGGYKNGIAHQDLQNLTLADDTFDLIVTEDVFEHVADLERGFREILRVLKVGGLHIFSVPYYFGSRTRALFTVRDGARVLDEPVEYHGDPIRGRIPCYNDIGFDLFDSLAEIGFEVRIEVSMFAEELEHGTFDSTRS